MREAIDEKTTVTRGYAPVNRLAMYYEIEGSGGATRGNGLPPRRDSLTYRENAPPSPIAKPAAAGFFLYPFDRLLSTNFCEGLSALSFR